MSLTEIFYFTVPSVKFEQYTFITNFLQLFKFYRLENTWRNFFNRFWAHYNYHTAEDWAILGESAGFEVIKSSTYNPKRACMLNTMLTPFGLPSMVIKKLINRWVVWPRLHELLMLPINPVVSKFLDGADVCVDGGLVFVALRKPVK